MSWWRWNASPKPDTTFATGDFWAPTREYIAKVCAEQVELAMEDRKGPSCMWDWISPARIKRPYAE